MMLPRDCRTPTEAGAPAVRTLGCRVSLDSGSRLQAVPMVERYRVDDDSAGMRLDRFLADRLADLSRTRIQHLIAAGAVTVEGHSARKRHHVAAGESIAVDLDGLENERDTLLQPENIALDILYEDDELLAVNKPAGLVVHPGTGVRTGTLVHALLYHCEGLPEGHGADRPGIVHRLDKDTSGVVVVAKTARAHMKLAAQFAERIVDKYYLGVAIGPRPPDHALLEGPIGRSRNDPTRFCVRRGGKPARTEYFLLRYRSGVAALRLRLHTGRTHQIRVHLAHAGMPIAADAAYGGDRHAAAALEPLDRPFAFQVLKSLTRQALHAHVVELEHPSRGERMRIVAPLPDELAGVFGLLDVTASEWT